MSLPLALLLAAVLSWSFGVAGLMAKWRSTARLQLRLDECVRERAGEARGVLRSVEESNRAMERLRVLAAATPEPATRASLRASLQAMAAAQAAMRVRWETGAAAWKLRRCGEGALLSGPGRFPWRTPAPDLLGPRPLEWSGPEPRCLALRAFRGPRGAAAELRQASGSWEGRWVPAWTGGCHGI